ncbi:amino acid ABC transporter substrate-binding protein (PAAT family) [Tamilnaduibacter salinus]|uniref:Amino acid ABC transporter substrate-binding protein n=1 Tax=Tamilnaduibacter salinus TaxID=1484056 RepID=A0A2A2I5P8_9GAMM|nr:transporter substrate-binding domain-containing protein [Tamilnaduibacter salinus]PAV26626.1 amino acid ABC transporter substrate-binding protein [Tamilnaduibacter salinus]PVY75829.1 amino acid ABC transporter substrate-binding protein (PAAT family) [Tamilnaduibacter salinus]
MRIQTLLCTAILATASVFSSMATADLKDYQMMTETYPPFNFRVDGELKGISVDMLMAASDKAGLGIQRSDIQLLPWARGYQTLQNKPQTMLFATTRTEKREPLFKWAGPITDTKIALIAKKGSDVTLNSASDFASPSIAVVRDDVAEELVRDAGATDGNLDLNPKPEPAMRKLQAGRVDLWAYEQNVAFWLINNAGFDTDNFEVVHVLSEGELFYAFHKDTPDEVVSTLQSALDALSDQERASVLSQYR